MKCTEGKIGHSLYSDIYTLLFTFFHAMSRYFQVSGRGINANLDCRMIGRPNICKIRFAKVFIDPRMEKHVVYLNHFFSYYFGCSNKGEHMLANYLLNDGKFWIKFLFLTIAIVQFPKD